MDAEPQPAVSTGRQSILRQFLGSRPRASHVIDPPPPQPTPAPSHGHRRRPAANVPPNASQPPTQSQTLALPAPQPNPASQSTSGFGQILRRRRSTNAQPPPPQAPPAPTAGTATGPSTTAANPDGRTHRIRLVPHLDAVRSLHFDPVLRECREGAPPIRIGRFTDRSGAAPSAATAGKIAFKSKVVSRGHAELWCDASGKFFIKDTSSSSGTFLNHLRLSPPNTDSRPFPLKDGDVLQLGVDYQGGTEEIYRCVKIRVEVGREWQSGANAFNSNAFKQLKALSNTALTGNTPGVKPKQGAATTTTECCICLFQVAILQSLFIAPCSHIFHYKCIRPLLIQHHPGFCCPLCRTFADLEADVEVEAESPEAAEPFAGIEGVTAAAAAVPAAAGSEAGGAAGSGVDSEPEPLSIIVDHPEHIPLPGTVTRAMQAERAAEAARLRAQALAREEAEGIEVEEEEEEFVRVGLARPPDDDGDVEMYSGSLPPPPPPSSVGTGGDDDIILLPTVSAPASINGRKNGGGAKRPAASRTPVPAEDATGWPGAATLVPPSGPSAGPSASAAGGGGVVPTLTSPSSTSINSPSIQELAQAQIQRAQSLRALKEKEREQQQALERQQAQAQAAGGSTRRRGHQTTPSTTTPPPGASAAAIAAATIRRPSTADAAAAAVANSVAAAVSPTTRSVSASGVTRPRPSAPTNGNLYPPTTGPGSASLNGRTRGAAARNGQSTNPFVARGAVDSVWSQAGSTMTARTTIVGAGSTTPGAHGDIGMRSASSLGMADALDHDPGADGRSAGGVSGGEGNDSEWGDPMMTTVEDMGAPSLAFLRSPSGGSARRGAAVAGGPGGAGAAALLASLGAAVVAEAEADAAAGRRRGASDDSGASGSGSGEEMLMMDGDGDGDMTAEAASGGSGHLSGPHGIGALAGGPGGVVAGAKRKRVAAAGDVTGR